MKRIFKEGSIATCWTGTSIAFQIWGQNGNFIIVLLGIFFRKKFGSKCKFLGVKMQRNLKLGGENKNSRESMGENINLKSLKVDHLKLPTWQFIQLSSFSLSSPSTSFLPLSLSPLPHSYIKMFRYVQSICLLLRSKPQYWKLLSSIKVQIF